MKSPLMRLLFIISSWLCAIAALHLGLIGLLGEQRNLVKELLEKLGIIQWVWIPLLYIFGIAGIICLIVLLMEAMNPGSCIKE